MRFPLVATVAVLLICPSLSAENWMRFRGDNGQGKSKETGLPITWSPEQNIEWSVDIPGTGWSSPIVYEDNIFVTTATEEGVSCRIVCVDRSSGKIRWNIEVHRQVTGPKRRQNSYATPTPVTDGKKVYAVFYDGTAVAADFDGNVVWTNSEIKFHSLHGLGASPIIVGDNLIMPYDGSSREENRVGWKEPWDKAVIPAYDLESGKIQWRAKRGLSRVGHVTPILSADRKQFISSGGDRVQGFDIATGKRIWSIYSQGEGVTPSPVLGAGLILTSSGFEEPTLRAIRPGGKGDITDSHIVWEQVKGVPVLASPLFVDPYLYTVTRDNILHCIEAKTGDIVWTKRLDGVYSASPVLVEGRMYFTSEEGVTLVLEPGDEYKEIARNELGERCLASFAVSHQRFYVRSEKRLYSIGK